jgi:ubiquinone/menaquinone biosynthesis C-methylase UbiE
LKLDVGCGHNPTGDVNIDPFQEATSHRSGDQRSCDDYPIDVSKTPNFIKATGEAIPIRSEIFEVAYSSHTIEHSIDPRKFLREICRVTKHGGVVKMSCPHRFEPSRRMKTQHINHFTSRWFRKSFKVLGFKIINTRTTLRGFPNNYLAIINLPSEIYFEARKS